MTDISFTDYHVMQLKEKVHTAIQLLEKYSLDRQCTHRERNSVEATVVMLLSDVKHDLNDRLAGTNAEKTDIPF